MKERGRVEIEDRERGRLNKRQAGKDEGAGERKRRGKEEG